jgi:DNA-binding CsgD family transcriptional regulator
MLTRSPSARPKSGVVLMDMSLQLIASDQGAAQILEAEQPVNPAREDLGLVIPEGILREIRNRTQTGTSDRTLYFLIGRRKYRCRSYLLRPKLKPAIMAVHFDTEELTSDPIAPIAAEYGLTDREHESLRGIALGLTNKELADRMQISPNTAKAHVRLIMLKLGVTTRGAILGRILDRVRPTLR